MSYLERDLRLVFLAGRLRQVRVTGRVRQVRWATLCKINVGNHYDQEHKIELLFCNKNALFIKICLSKKGDSDETT